MPILVEGDGSSAGAWTQIYTLKGCRPDLLDDTAIWCAWRDSNSHAEAVDFKSTVYAIPPQAHKYIWCGKKDSNP